MRSNILLKTLLALFSITAFAACSGGGGGGSGGKSLAEISNCVSVPAGSVKWTYEECGPLTRGHPVDIRGATTGYVPSGSGYKLEPLDSHFPVGKGQLTFTVSGLDWSDYPYPANDVIFVLFMAESPSTRNATAFREANWHILGWRDDPRGGIWLKMVAQRSDGRCLPDLTRECERKSDAMDAPAFSRSSTYRFDCVWDTSGSSGWYGDGAGDGYAECSIYDITNPASAHRIITHTVPTGGPYEKLNYLCVGGGCGPMVSKPSLPTTLTNFRFTILE